MSDPDAPPLDDARIAEVLDAHGVEYVLVGGLGARLRGATKPTRDFDFCPASDRENLERVAAALRSLRARLRVHDLPEGLSIPIDAQFLAGMELSPWRTDAGDVDVLRGIPAESMAHLNRYPELITAADAVEFAGCRIHVASLDHIILSKETTNRPPDHEALPELRALRAAGLAAAAYPEGIEAALAQDPSPARTDRPPAASHGPEYRPEPPGRSLQ